MVTRAEVVREARRWLGVPYRLTGRDRAGVDCCNLPAEVYRALGLLDVSLPPYRRIGESELLSHLSSLGLRRLSPPVALPGDLLIFRAYAWNCHPGIMTERGVVHCPAGPVVEQALVAVGGRVIAAYRVPGVV